VATGSGTDENPRVTHAHRPPVDPACAIAHGELPPNTPPRTLVTVFDSPVADQMMHFGRDLGFRTVLLEPDNDILVHADWRYADLVSSLPTTDIIDQTTDVVITDHHRPELGRVLSDILRLPARWIGVIGSVRHTAPHIAQLRSLGVPDYAIARVRRPVGLNIGSQTPAEIAIATLAGLIADRNRRPGGFAF
jgi:xanthine/CO dehydrogenase XdhC/CoxF family maturation factor